MATRATPSDPWGEPANLGPTINSSVGEWYPSISADGLVLFFQDDNLDMCLAQRRTTTEPFGPVVKLPPQINTSGVEGAPSVSSDGSTLYFSGQNRPGDIDFGSNDIWQVSIDRIVDLNGDGVVNSEDVTVMVNHWGEDYPSCDIGPMPWGDGIVDVEDLIVLSEHLFEDVDDPTLVAHWPLDETEGSTAHDSVNGNDDTVMGGALWQPAGGVVGGALEFDGVGDCVIASFGLNPADPEISSGFSMFARIKGGAPGQAVVSEPMGHNWLMADANGKLMTELKSAGRGATPLLSEAIITDGQWHRIGLVWDGSHRTLCVDGVVVAEDTQNDLEAYAGGFYIGVGKDYAAGTFFSGLIDDVRIYNRVVSP